MTQLRTRIAALLAQTAKESGEKRREVKVMEDMPICGAIGKRTGRPCQVRILGRGGRCYLHGGASTGPKTQGGRDRSRATIMKWNETRHARARAAQTSMQPPASTPSPTPVAPTPTPVVKTRARDRGLVGPLQEILDRVGPENYGNASARELYRMRQLQPRRPRYGIG